MTFRSLLDSYNPLRHYYLNETSGTVAHDYGTQGVNGTIHGTLVNAPGLLTDSYDPCMVFNGSNVYVDAPTTGLPTGNHAISLVGVAKLPTTPGFYCTALSLGASGSNQSINLYSGDAGTNGNKLDCSIHGAVGVSDNVDAALNSHAIWLWGCTYDGSTLILWINGQNVGQVSVSSLNLSYGSLLIGNDPSNEYFLGQLSDAAVFDFAISPSQWPTLYTALTAGMSGNTSPSEGHWLYERVNAAAGNAFSRLDDIASKGFKGVINYGLLQGNPHIADVQAYINHAASDGLKVIVDLSTLDIWKTPAIAADYPNLYSDSGNQSTVNGFDTYIVNQLKGLSGTWGYYVADEPGIADHAACLAHYGYIAAADAIKPKLLISSAEQFTNNFWSAGGPFADCCTVGGDDFYPVGDDVEAALIAAHVYSGIQKQCNFSSIKSAVVLQAFDWNAYGSPPCSTAPLCAYYPYRYQMQQQLTGALANMTADMVLWYSYHDTEMSNTPISHWTDLLAVLHPSPGVSTQGNGRFARIG